MERRRLIENVSIFNLRFAVIFSLQCPWLKSFPQLNMLRMRLNWFNSRCWITKNILGRLFSWNHYSNLGLMANKSTRPRIRTLRCVIISLNDLKQAFAGLLDCVTRPFQEQRKIQQKNLKPWWLVGLSFLSIFPKLLVFFSQALLAKKNNNSNWINF